jgi:hypothetical protein
MASFHKGNVYPFPFSLPRTYLLMNRHYKDKHMSELTKSVDQDETVLSDSQNAFLILSMPREEALLTHTSRT